LRLAVVAVDRRATVQFGWPGLLVVRAREAHRKRILDTPLLAASRL
jgi:hypothetical protein